MSEIAIIALLLLPNWGYFTEIRNKANDYIRPNNAITRHGKQMPTIKTLPIGENTDSYVAKSKAAYSIDLDTNVILTSKKQDERLQIASLTKLMTAYVILKDQENLDKKITIPSFTLQENDAIVGIYPGEQYSIRDLLSGMLINSGSDAAQALAIMNSGSEEKFVLEMNSKADELGLSNTHYNNPVGWDSSQNYSSAKDIANLSRILLANEFFKKTVSTKTKTIYSVSGKTINLISTNQLLDSGYSGIKTGYTYGALECLVSLEEINSHKIITVILGSNNRFGETVNLNKWTNTHFSW